MSAARPPDGDRQRDAAFQRVRVGLTGLAAVFLLTLLAASILSLLGQDGRGARADRPNGVASAADAPREPLAELGVAPGNAAKIPAESPGRPTTASPTSRPRR